MTADVVALLREALGDRVDTSPPALDAARRDKSGHESAAPPLAVVHAASVEDVQRTLRIATATRTPVVTRGAGTGLAGGALAGAGAIALSVRSMTRVLEVRPDDLLAVVEPGVLNGNLNAALAADALWWPPDPASRAISTVGGNIATGAGGLLCAKYGVVRDWVLGVDLVLADGRMLRLGHRSVKGVTGLDLTSLVIGSEGILGVVVGATLKLRRVVEGEQATLSATFPDVRAAAAGSAAITASGVQPAVQELMDAQSLAAVHAHLGLPAPAPGATQLIVQTDGPAALEEADALAATLRAAGGIVRVARDRAEGERLLEIRRSAHPAFERYGTTLIEDIAVPRSALPAMFEEIARIERERGMLIPTIAHAGDGNLHPNFIVPGSRPEDPVPAEVWDAADELFRAALRLGGTLTGEHGVGVLKRRWLRDELGDDQWRLQRDIARTFDPLGILNPGAVFEPAVHVSAILVLDEAGRALVVRKRGTAAFMQPGGKPEPGETPAATAVRELAEEIGVTLAEAELTPLGRFTADAANEPGHRVVAESFLARIDPGAVAAAGEIEELRWIDPADRDLPLAPLSVGHLLPIAEAHLSR